MRSLASPRISMLPPTDDVVFHTDAHGRAMVYIGKLARRNGRVGAAPCRGITRAQTTKLLAAYDELRDQDVWTMADVAPGGAGNALLVTYVSVPLDPVRCGWTSPRILRQMRQNTWASRRPSSRSRGFYFKGAPRSQECLGLRWPNQRIETE